MPSFDNDVSVFDLPNLRSRPTFEVLQKTLQHLELKPNSWDSVSQRNNGSLNEVALSRYLTNIISCFFEWFEDSEEGDVDVKREILWDLASRRMTERCGRSAMGELNRTWTIPESEALPSLSFDIREPPLTGDNLGFKTWGTAFVMAKRLEYIHKNFLQDALRKDSQVLELGAGTGLVGIAASAVWSANVVLTDLDEILPNLKHNIAINNETVITSGGTVSGEVLDWKSPSGLAAACQDFDIVIAADSLYDDEHPALVTKMISKYLAKASHSRALVAVPLRDKNTIQMAGDFKERLESSGLKIVHEDWEECRDDWETAGDEAVKCWWAVLKRCR